MNGAASPTPAQRLAVLRVIWVAFLGSVAVYTVAFAMIRSAGGAVAPDLAATLRPIFWVGALALAWASQRVRQRFARTVVSQLPGQAAQAVGQLQTSCVVAWAMSEAVAILGLVLGCLTHGSGDFLPFAFGSVALLYLHRPAAWPLDRLVPQVGGGRGAS